MLKEGDKAPAFDLECDAGKPFSSRSLAGKSYVVYFYPRDDTPGCTREAIEFTKAKKKFEAAGALVLGVSKDSIASHCKFRDKYRLAIPLLADPDLVLHKAYGAWGEKTMYGKKVTGVIRSTFVVGPDGKIRRVFPSVKVDGHADKVLEALAAKDGDPKAAAASSKAAAAAKRVAVKAKPTRAAEPPKRPKAKSSGRAAASARRASAR